MCSVNYEIPKSSHIHKSMLLRGVKFPEPALDYGDIMAVKNKAQNSGRSFGGAPFRNNNGGNRGGRINYGNQERERPNPFAAHLDPNFKPAGNNAPSGWVPPMPGSTGFSRGPPGPPRGGMSGYPDGRHQYQNRGSYGGPPRQNYGRDDYYGQGQQGYQSSSNWRGRGGGYSRGGRDSYGSRNQGGYGRY